MHEFDQGDQANPTPHPTISNLLYALILLALIDKKVVNGTRFATAILIVLAAAILPVPKKSRNEMNYHTIALNSKMICYASAYSLPTSNIGIAAKYICLKNRRRPIYQITNAK